MKEKKKTERKEEGQKWVGIMKGCLAFVNTKFFVWFESFCWNGKKKKKLLLVILLTCCQQQFDSVCIKNKIKQQQLDSVFVGWLWKLKCKWAKFAQKSLLLSTKLFHLPTTKKRFLNCDLFSFYFSHSKCGVRI